MVDHNNFYENLERIQDGELVVARLLNSRFDDLYISMDLNNDCKYDIKGILAGDLVTFEVKEDIRCADTGNIVVEFESRGIPSGISTTEADFWVFRIHRNNKIHHYIIGTERLKRLIKEKKYSRIYKMIYTDSKNRVYFFRFRELIKWCYQLN